MWSGVHPRRSLPSDEVHEGTKEAETEEGYMKTTRHGDYEKTVRFLVWSNYAVRIVFTHDIGKSLNARGNPRKTEATEALHWNIGNGSVLIFKIGDCASGTIAHECWHAIRTMLVDYCGVETMEDEVTAYHLGYLVQQVTNFRNELIDKKVGVKSETEVRTNGIGNSQESIGRMRRLQPGETAPGETRTS